MSLTRNGTADPDHGKSRVYGGDCNLVHIPDGERKAAGVIIAEYLDTFVRGHNRALGRNADGLLCPGCAMIALFNAALVTAERNGQPRAELAATMRNAFDRLLRDPAAGLTEEIEIILDPEPQGAAVAEL